MLDGAGEVVFDRPVRNEEAAIEQLIEDAGLGAVLVIDQPGSIGTLAVAQATGYDAWLAGRVKKDGQRKAVVVPSAE